MFNVISSLMKIIRIPVFGVFCTGIYPPRDKYLQKNLIASTF